MRCVKLVSLGGLAVGAAFGVALGASPVAAADSGTSPIDTWLYGVDGAQYGLPGVTQDGVTYDYDGGGGSIPWYTVNASGSGTNTSEVVTAVLDPSPPGTPSIGTVDHEFAFNVLNYSTEYPTEYAVYTNSSISDPHVGTGDYSTWFGHSFTNFYVSDKAGIEDQVTFGGGQPITLFDFPAAGTGSSDADAGMDQLMADLLGGVAGSAAVPDLF